MPEAGAEHHSHRTRRTVGCGAPEDTLFAAQCPDTTPVIRRYLQEAEKSIIDHAKPQTYVALTRIIGTRQIWLGETIVRGAPLELWRTDVRNGDLVAVRLTDVMSVGVFFDDHAAHSKRQLIVDKGTGVDRIINWRRISCREQRLRAGLRERTEIAHLLRWRVGWELGGILAQTSI